MQKYTVHCETTGLELVPCKENLVYEIAVVSTVQFNSFIDFEWFHNGLIDNSSLYHHHTTAACLLLVTGTIELDKIHRLVHQMSLEILPLNFYCISWPNFDALKYLL